MRPRKIPFQRQEQKKGEKKLSQDSADNQKDRDLDEKRNSVKSMASELRDKLKKLKQSAWTSELEDSLDFIDFFNNDKQLAKNHPSYIKIFASILEIILDSIKKNKSIDPKVISSSIESHLPGYTLGSISDDSIDNYIEEFNRKMINFVNERNKEFKEFKIQEHSNKKEEKSPKLLEKRNQIIVRFFKKPLDNLSDPEKEALYDLADYIVKNEDEILLFNDPAKGPKEPNPRDIAKKYIQILGGDKNVIFNKQEWQQPKDETLFEILVKHSEILINKFKLCEYQKIPPFLKKGGQTKNPAPG